jgi:integrase
MWHRTADFRAAAISSGIGGSTDFRKACPRGPFVSQCRDRRCFARPNGCRSFGSFSRCRERILVATLLRQIGTSGQHRTAGSQSSHSRRSRNWNMRTGSAGPPLTMRKAAARRLADAGCTPHQIMAITGHRSLKEVTRYTRAAEQRRLAQAAMARLQQQDANKNSQP